jgi:hypothetical protein
LYYKNLLCIFCDKKIVFLNLKLIFYFSVYHLLVDDCTDLRMFLCQMKRHFRGHYSMTTYLPFPRVTTFHAIKRGGMEAVTSASAQSTSSMPLWDVLGVEAGSGMDAGEGKVAMVAEMGSSPRYQCCIAAAMEVGTGDGATVGLALPSSLNLSSSGRAAAGRVCRTAVRHGPGKQTSGSICHLPSSHQDRSNSVNCS